ncbi:MAG: CaiB/BaiF CoA transferase family protein [Acidimicrobiales bacterium]
MTGPYHDVTVIDLSGLAGAQVGRMLAGLGADVIKIEPPSGNPMRRLGPFAPDRETSLWWAYLAMGTRSAVVDLDDDSHLADLSALLATADVVVDDHGPGVLDGRGIGHDTVAATNPGVVRVEITPFGPSGPKRVWRSSNLVARAASGVLYTVGFEDQAPVVPGGPAQLAMHAVGMEAAFGAALGLRARRITGRGQRVGVSLVEACLSFAPETGVPLLLDDRVHRGRTGNRRNLGRPFGLYPCADGYASILVLMPRHWDAIAAWVHEACGNDAITDPVFADIGVRAETMELVDAWVEELSMSMTVAELFQEGQRRGIPVTPVNTVDSLRADPHLDAVGFWRPGELPDGQKVTVPGPPMRTTADWWEIGRAPRLGEHTGAVFPGRPDR